MAYFEAVVLTVLGLSELRTLIAYTGAVEPGTRLGRFFYGRFEERVLEQALQRFGLTRFDLQRVNSWVGRSGAESGDCHIQLLQLLLRHVHRMPVPIVYGKETPTSSSYYLNTMEASHNLAERELMVRLLNKLVHEKRRGRRFPDFALAPKAGNPLLAAAWAEANHVPLVLRKHAMDHSRARLPQGGRDSFVINFEGEESLSSFIDQVSPEDRLLEGILVDCNASGGSELLATLEEFNALSASLGLRVAPVKETYLLFRPDDADPIDRIFEERGYSVCRYFDLREPIKARLSAAARLASAQSREIELRMVFKNLRESGLVKAEVTTSELGYCLADGV